MIKMLHNKILCKDFEHVLISNDVIIKSYDIFKISEMIKSSTPGHLKSIFKWPVQKEILSQSSCAFSNRACDWPRAVLGKIDSVFVNHHGVFISFHTK